MKHGGSPSNDWPQAMQYFRIAMIGAGAAAPTVPTGALATLSGTSPDFPKRANALSTVAAEIPVRTGVGTYTCQYDPSFIVNKVLNTPIDVYGGTGGMWASVTSVVPTTRTITFATFSAGGAATDLPSGTSIVVISVEAQDSNM